MIRQYLNTPLSQSALLTAGLLLGQTLVFISVLPQYIPSWTLITQGWVILSYILMLLVCIRLYLQVRILLFDQVKPYIFGPLQILLALGMITWLGLGLTFTLMFTGHGLFGATHASTHPFPKYGKTLYLIDASFLDPLTKVMVKDSVWPIMSPLYLFPNVKPEAIKLEESQGHLSLSSPKLKVTYDLKTGQLKEAGIIPENLDSWGE